jgi:hypothetical protein
MTSARKSIINVLEEDNEFVSPGMLYHIARVYGYGGTQKDLIKTADEMIKAKQIIGRTRGQGQKVWYKLKEECSERELSYA